MVCSSFPTAVRANDFALHRSEALCLVILSQRALSRALRVREEKSQKLQGCSLCATAFRVRDTHTRTPVGTRQVGSGEGGCGLAPGPAGRTLFVFHPGLGVRMRQTLPFLTEAGHLGY